MSSTFSDDETAPFFGFLDAAAALVFSCMGAAYSTTKSGVVASMGVMRPELVMKSIVLVVMVVVLGIHGLIIDVIISTSINSKAKSYYLFDGYAHFSSGLSYGLAGLAPGMAIGVVEMLVLGREEWEGEDMLLLFSLWILAELLHHSTDCMKVHPLDNQEDLFEANYFRNSNRYAKTIILMVRDGSMILSWKQIERHNW